MKRRVIPVPQDEQAVALAPAEYEDADCSAMYALSQGNASEEQQRRAYTWILESACRMNELPYVPGSLDLSAFIAGRIFVGKQIQKVTQINPAFIKEKTHG